MSKPQNACNSSPKKGESSATPDILSSDRDETFFRSLYEFIEHEKEYQECPEEGPDQLRYVIYRSVFNKVFFKSFHITEWQSLFVLLTSYTIYIKKIKWCYNIHI